MAESLGFSPTKPISVVMSVVPKVTYWPGRGRCEPLRCIFAAAAVKFENDFIKGREHMLEIVATGKLAYDQVGSPPLKVILFERASDGVQAR